MNNILNSNFANFNPKHIEEVINENRNQLEKSLDQIEDSINKKITDIDN